MGYIFTNHSYFDDALVQAIFERMGIKDDAPAAEVIAKCKQIQECAPMIIYTDGFTNRADNAKFFADWKTDIMEAARNNAEDMGESFAGMLSIFNCFKDYDIVELLLDTTSENFLFPSGMVWFTGEEIARAVCDECIIIEDGE